MDQNALHDVLRQQGFSEPLRWLEYARQHHFRPTPSQRLARCPDCGGERSRDLGQYVYYSTLARLRFCQRCRLAYSDIRLDQAVVRAHFESVYKDERYFTTQRRRVFEQLAGLVDRFAPLGGSVLDFGGAKGHLLWVVTQRRPDLRVTLMDVSGSACAWARAAYGFAAIPGSVTALQTVEEPYDVVVLSDVIYYEPEAPKLWHLLPRVVAAGGAVVIRVPNSLGTIRLAQHAIRAVTRRSAWAMRDRIMFFNPEHLFVFSRDFLVTKLRALGFHDVVARPAEVGIPGGFRSVARFAWLAFARAAYRLSGGRAILTPSLIVSGRR